MLSPIRSDLLSPVADEKYGHPSPVAEEKSDLPSPKRQKLEEATCDEKRVSYFNEDVTDEEIQRWYDEWDKSQGFEMDFSKVTYCSSWQQVDLDEITYCSAPGTCRDFIARLANMALKDHNAKENANLKLGKILRANFYPFTYYISFEVTDLSDGNQTKPYRAIVYYLNEEDHQMILDAIEQVKGVYVVTAGHGNAEDMMKRAKAGKPALDKEGKLQILTSHTLKHVPIATGGPRLSEGVRFSKDLETPGLANVAATVMNLHGFVAPTDYEPTLIEVKN